jgi:hypothetical protein
MTEIFKGAASTAQDLRLSRERASRMTEEEARLVTMSRRAIDRSLPPHPTALR